MQSFRKIEFTAKDGAKMMSKQPLPSTSPTATAYAPYDSEVAGVMRLLMTLLAEVSWIKAWLALVPSLR